jgi:phosphoribosylamine--glycine ligase
MKVLVIGEGASEHTLVWKLSQSRHVDKIYCCPGNREIAETAEYIDVSPYNFRTLIDFVKYEWIDLTIAVSQDLFLKGIVNAFEKDGCRILGPHKAAAQCMTSRVFLKNLMRRHRIPTTEYKVFTSYLHAQDYIRLRTPPFVIKTDGSLDNRGVFTALTIEDAMDTLKMIMEDMMFGDAGKHVIVEESLQGEKVTFVAVTDGQAIAPFTDLYKYEDREEDSGGLHTTVMGAYSPAGVITEELKNTIMTQIMGPLLKALKSEGIHYKGFLFADLICDQKRPYLFELQCCFPNPETQTILPRLKNDFVDFAFSVTEERLFDSTLELTNETSLCMNLYSRSYPQKERNSFIINGLEGIESMKDIAVFHGSTSLSDTKRASGGEMILSITAIGNDIEAAKETAGIAIDKIYFDGMYYGKDIINK